LKHSSEWVQKAQQQADHNPEDDELVSSLEAVERESWCIKDGTRVAQDYIELCLEYTLMDIGYIVKELIADKIDDVISSSSKGLMEAVTAFCKQYDDEYSELSEHIDSGDAAPLTVLLYGRYTYEMYIAFCNTCVCAKGVVYSVALMREALALLQFVSCKEEAMKKTESSLEKTESSDGGKEEDDAEEDVSKERDVAKDAVAQAKLAPRLIVLAIYDMHVKQMKRYCVVEKKNWHDDSETTVIRQLLTQYPTESSSNDGKVPCVFDGAKPDDKMYVELEEEFNRDNEHLKAAITPKEAKLIGSFFGDESHSMLCGEGSTHQTLSLLYKLFVKTFNVHKDRDVWQLCKAAREKNTGNAQMCTALLDHHGFRRVSADVTHDVTSAALYFRALWFDIQKDRIEKILETMIIVRDQTEQDDEDDDDGEEDEEGDEPSSEGGDAEQQPPPATDDQDGASSGDRSSSDDDDDDDEQDGDQPPPCVKTATINGRCVAFPTNILPASAESVEESLAVLDQFYAGDCDERHDAMVLDDTRRKALRSRSRQQYLIFHVSIWNAGMRSHAKVTSSSLDSEAMMAVWERLSASEQAQILAKGRDTIDEVYETVSDVICCEDIQNSTEAFKALSDEDMEQCLKDGFELFQLQQARKFSPIVFKTFAREFRMCANGDADSECRAATLLQEELISKAGGSAIHMLTYRDDNNQDQDLYMGVVNNLNVVTPAAEKLYASTENCLACPLHLLPYHNYKIYYRRAVMAKRIYDGVIRLDPKFKDLPSAQQDSLWVESYMAVEVEDIAHELALNSVEEVSLLDNPYVYPVCDATVQSFIEKAKELQKQRRNESIGAILRRSRRGMSMGEAVAEYDKQLKEKCLPMKCAFEKSEVDENEQAKQSSSSEEAMVHAV